MCTHAACLSGAGCPSLRHCLLSSLLFNPVNCSPLQRIFPEFHVRESPLPISGGFKNMCTAGADPWSLQLYPTSLAAISGWLGIDNLLFTARVWLWLGRAFPLTFRALHFNFCHCSLSFYCHGGTFLSLQHLLTSETDNAVGGRTCPRRSPLLAGRGHYCITFLLEFSIPAVPSSADCQLRLPSCSPLCHQCSCSLLSFSQGEHQRSKGPSVPIPKQDLLWWSTGGPAGPQTWSLRALSIYTSDLNSSPVIGTCGFIIRKLHNIKERLFPLFHK